MEKKKRKRLHDPFFRWLFAVVKHLRLLLELSGKVNAEVGKFLSMVNLDTLVRIPDSYSNVDDTGEADLAFRVNVASGAPVLVGILLEHKSGRDPNVFEQITKYANSLMKMRDKNSELMRLPTMAIIFYNGHENWDPLKEFNDEYPEYFRGWSLPYRCTFVNMADIPDRECLACKYVEVGMGIAAMKYAFNGKKLVEILPSFKESLAKLPPYRVSCLLHKISVYLGEYVNEDIQKELDMAFVSVGQKYGFVSAGDVFRKKLTDAHNETEKQRQRAEKAREVGHDDVFDVLQDMGIPSEKIEEARTRLASLNDGGAKVK